MLYFDNAATTFPKPQEVYDYVDWVQRNIAVNVGRGSYSVARKAMDIVEETRTKIANFFHASSERDVVFCPSATIAANEIVGGLDWDNLKNIYVSPFEHNAIMRPIEKIKTLYGCNIYELPFDGKTQELDYDEMLRLFSLHNPDYVFLNQVSNVTGVILPVNEIGREAKKYGACVIIDGSQSAGVVDIDLRKDVIDFLIFAGHKNLYSSWGVGGFVINTDRRLHTFITGGTGSDSLNLTVDDFEVGSPNIIAIASLNKSLDWINKIGIDNIAEHKKKIVDMLVGELNGLGVKMFLPSNMENHTSVVSFILPEYEPVEVGTILDQDFDIAVRTGYHCAPLVHRLIGSEVTKGTIRASVSYFTNESDVKEFVNAVKDI